MLIAAGRRHPISRVQQPEHTTTEPIYTAKAHAAGYTACFLRALGLVTRRAGVKLGEHSFNSEVDLIKDDSSFHIGCG